jgi:hypothetical protein
LAFFSLFFFCFLSLLVAEFKVLLFIVVADYGGKTDKYNWTQGEEDVTITVPLPAGTRGRDIQCVIKPDSLKLSYKASSNPIIDVSSCSLSCCCCLVLLGA